MPPTCPDRRRLLQAAAALPLAGCVAMPYGTYFRPSTDAPGARLRRAWCQGNAGPETRLAFEAGPIHVSARTERDYPERDRPDWPLRIELLLPRARPVRFQGDAVALRTLAGGRAIDAPAQVRAHGTALRPADAEIDPVAWRPAAALGRSIEPGAPQGWATLSLAEPSGLDAQVLRVEPPAVLIGSRHIAPPRPLLRAVVPGADTTGALLSAEQAEALRARTPACRADAAARACLDVLRHARWSFEHADADFAWRGEWARFRGVLHRAGVALAAQGPAPWRLARPRVLVYDEAGAARAELPVREISLRSGETIALSTPLHDAPAPGGGDTRLAIEIALPGDVPGFEVKLPAAMVGDRRVDLPPLRFERRSLDGGIEPFNC